MLEVLEHSLLHCRFFFSCCCLIRKRPSCLKQIQHTRMMGSFLTRGLVMAFGYAYPAYECFKSVEMNKPEIEQLRFWCQYWILVAALTVFERIGDIFISWLPMYSEAKLAFFVYLWYPKTRGTTYVYESFLRPYVAKHETEIDRNLMELRTRAGDLAVMYWQQAASYSQTRMFEVLHYVVSHSSSKPQPAQQQQQKSVSQGPPTPAPPTRPPAESSTSPPNTTKQSQQPKLRNAITSGAATKQQEPATNAADPLPSPKPAAHHVEPPTQSQPEASSQQQDTVENVKAESNTALTITDGNAKPPAPETVMDEAIRITRGRLRKTRAPPTSH